MFFLLLLYLFMTNNFVLKYIRIKFWKYCVALDQQNIVLKDIRIKLYNLHISL